MGWEWEWEWEWEHVQRGYPELDTLLYPCKVLFKSANHPERRSRNN
jgi:cobalamin biosynthesis protein CobT